MILNYIGSLKLTSDQLQAVRGLQDFIDGSNRVFILKGYAGTGKTTLLKGLINYLQKEGILGHVMAPTGRAAKVIQDKTGYNATTIHKGIYNFERLFTHDDKEQEQSFRYYFGLNCSPANSNLVYIIDEASMIGNRKSETEFFRFGSGKLLDDLVSFVDLTGAGNHRLILVGDPAQLPPVGETLSEALESSTFEKYGVSSFEMKTIVRQNPGSGLQKNADYYRSLIFSQQVSENCLDIQFDDIVPCSVDQLIDAYLTYAPVPGSHAVQLITYSNSLASIYNSIIRKEYFPEGKLVEPGDVLQVVQNNYIGNEALLNGEFVQVLEVDPTTIRQSASIYVDQKRIHIDLDFLRVKFRNSEGIVMEKLIIASLLKSREATITPYENRALYVNFVMRCKHKAGTSQFAIELKNDPYFNALRVKYGYAITGHKSQGGEWEHVCIDFDGAVGRSNDRLRWAYTAITRASKKLYVLNSPQLKQLDFSKMGTVTIGKTSKLPLKPSDFPQVEATPFHGMDSHPCKRIKYHDLKEKFEEKGFSISGLNSLQYQETYFVSMDGFTYQLDLWHNESGIFAPARCNKADAKAQMLIEIANLPVAWEFPIRYEAKTNALYLLHQHVQEAIAGKACKIIHVDDSNLNGFVVTYILQTIAQGAFLQFYFNKNEVFTSIIAKSLSGADDLVLKEVIEELLKTS